MTILRQITKSCLHSQKVYDEYILRAIDFGTSFKWKLKEPIELKRYIALPNKVRQI